VKRKKVNYHLDERNDKDDNIKLDGWWPEMERNSVKWQNFGTSALNPSGSF